MASSSLGSCCLELGFWAKKRSYFLQNTLEGEYSQTKINDRVIEEVVRRDGRGHL